MDPPPRPTRARGRPPQADVSVRDDVTAQLVDEIGGRATALGALIGGDAIVELERRVATHAPVWAAQMAQDDDDRLAAQTVIDIMVVLWPDSDPPDHWWRTPTGRLCARSLCHSTAESVTHARAAHMLGLARGTVSTMVSRGTLDRHPDGGVDLAAVLARLARQS